VALDTTHIKGLAELDRRLAALGGALGQKVLRNATRAAMTPVLKAARAAAPKGTEAHRTYQGRLVAPGFAARNLRVITYRNRQTGKVGALLGVRREAFYALQFWVYGAYGRKRKDWLTPVFEAHESEMLQRLQTEAAKRIDKAAKS
jgi:hypothetical protein